MTPSVVKLRKALAQRALRGAKLLDNGCRVFRGSTDKHGFCRFKFRSRLYSPHRVVIEYLIDRPLLRNEDVRQTCGNRSCVEPDHLRLSSRRETLLDSIHEGRVTPPTSNPAAVAASNRRRAKRLAELRAFVGPAAVPSPAARSGPRPRMRVRPAPAPAAQPEPQPEPPKPGPRIRTRKR